MVDKNMLTQLRLTIKDKYNSKYGEIFNHRDSLRGYSANLIVNLYNKGLTSSPIKVSKSEIWSYLHDKYSYETLEFLKIAKTGYFDYTDPLYLDFRVKQAINKVSTLRGTHNNDENRMSYLLELTDFVEDLKLITEYFKTLARQNSLDEIVEERRTKNNSFSPVTTYSYDNLEFISLNYKQVNQRYNLFYHDTLEPCDINAFYNVIEELVTQFLAETNDFKFERSYYQEVKDLKVKAKNLDLDNSNWTFLSDYTREDEIKYLPLILKEKVKATTQTGKDVLSVINKLRKFLGGTHFNRITSKIVGDSINAQLETINLEEETLSFIENANVFKRKADISYSLYLSSFAVDYDTGEELPLEYRVSGYLGLYTYDYDSNYDIVEPNPILVSTNGVTKPLYKVIEYDELYLKELFEEEHALIKVQEVSEDLQHIVDMFNCSSTYSLDNLELFNLSPYIKHNLRGISKLDVKVFTKKIKNLLKKGG